MRRGEFSWTENQSKIYCVVLALGSRRSQQLLVEAVSIPSVINLVCHF